jgi:hypothetical protein
MFEMIEQLKDPDCKVDLDRMKMIAEFGQVIVNSAKVEVDFLKTIGGNGTGFIPEDDKLKIGNK